VKWKPHPYKEDYEMKQPPQRKLENAVGYDNACGNSNINKLAIQCYDNTGCHTKA